MSKETTLAISKGNKEGNSPPEKLPAAAGQKFRDKLGRFLTGSGGLVKRFTSQGELGLAVVAYFEQCEADQESPTMTGLAASLGFKSRQSLVNYNTEAGYEQFFEVISWARMQVEENFEKRLVNQKTVNVAGLIFALKQMGWTDKQEIKMDQRSVQLTGFKMIRNDENHGSSDQTN